jgi:uncharacterized membrane protein
MNNKFLIAAIVGGIAYFLLGYLVYGLALMNFYTAHTMAYAGMARPAMMYWAIFLSSLSMATLMAWIFDKWGNIRTLSGGMMAGLIIGLLTQASFDLGVYAFFNLYDCTLVIVDIIVTGIFTAVIGGIIAWVLGYNMKPKAA